jgi:hypothetical protein
MNKLFSVAGVSTLPTGQVKIRLATDLAFRTKQLTQAEHTDIRLIELGTELSKEDAIAALADHEDYQDAMAQEVIGTAVQKIEDDLAVAERREAKATVTKEVVFTPDVTKELSMAFTPDL